MKLERLDVFTSNGEECKQYITDGEFVEWTPELQEAWDKQQEIELGEYYTCSKCNYVCFSDYEDDYKYCPNCGQKIKYV